MLAIIGLRDITLMTGIVIYLCAVNFVIIACDASLMDSLNLISSYSSYFGLGRSTALKSCATDIFFMCSFPAALAVDSLIERKCRVSGSYLAAISHIIDAVIQGSAQHVAIFYCRELFVKHAK